MGSLGRKEMPSRSVLLLLLLLVSIFFLTSSSAKPSWKLIEVEGDEKVGNKHKLVEFEDEEGDNENIANKQKHKHELNNEDDKKEREWRGHAVSNLNQFAEPN